MVQGTRSQPHHRVVREHRQSSPRLRHTQPALVQDGRLFHQALVRVSKRPYELHGLAHEAMSCAEGRVLKSGMAPGDWYP
jgi:hypothetical protein